MSENNSGTVAPKILELSVRAWFDVLEWTALIAGLKVINNSHPHVLLSILIGISSGALLIYFVTLGVRLDLPPFFNRWPVLKIAGGLVLTFGFVFVAGELADIATDLLSKPVVP
jgi:hypothetical protein